ncbi:MAG TPA: hypothetical protein VF418_03390, partial [Sphingomonadaceae bacterium]
MNRLFAGLALAAGLVLAGCGGHADSGRNALLGTPDEPGAWPRPGRDLGDSYFSPLDGIDASNVGKLGLA